MLLSVITINLNNLEGLKKTYNSLMPLFNDTRVEWLFIDGDSTDGSQKFVLESGKAAYQSSEKDNGIYDAMNKGLQASKANFVWFLNSGDEAINVNYLLQELESSTSTDILFFGWQQYTLGKLSTYRAKPKWYIKHSLPTRHQSIIYGKKEAQKIIYDLKYPVAADYAFTATIMASQLTRIKSIDFPISIFDTTGFSSNRSRQTAQEAWRIQREILKLPSIFRIISLVIKSRNFWKDFS